MVKEWRGHCTGGLPQYKYIRATAKTNDWLESGLSGHHLEREQQTNLNGAEHYVSYIMLAATNLVLAKSLIGNMDGKLVGGCGPFPVAVSAQLSVCPANCGGHRTTLMIPHIQIVKSNTMPIYKYHYHLTMVSAVSKDCSNH